MARDRRGPASVPTPLSLISDVLYPILENNRHLHELFVQEPLKEESKFVSWCRDLDVPVSGIVSKTDIDKFWRLGWIRADQVHVVHANWKRRLHQEPLAKEDSRAMNESAQGLGRWKRYELSLHPFRVYPIHRLLQCMEWRLVKSNVLYPPGVRRYAEQHIKTFQLLRRSPNYVDLVNRWNGIADLAILLEPLYWPDVTSRRAGRRIDSDSDSTWTTYREFALSTLARIPKEAVKSAHAELRVQAAIIDRNEELYLLIRAMKWDRRAKLRGAIGKAMWIRHMAEVIRLGYEEVHGEKLFHEDVAFGMWRVGAREWLYGSEYPLDNIREMIRRMAPRLGYVSGVRVRFYVEGDTEEGALEANLEDVLGYGVEIVNLRAQGWGTWLSQELENDVKAKRLSMFMLDGDRDDALRSLRSLVRQKLIVGMVFVNRPDFEFGLFDLTQLVKGIEHYEESVNAGFQQPLVVEQFEGVTCGKEFDQRYRELRSTKGLKGTEWGAALARVAWETPGASEQTNLLIHATMCAIRSMTTDYDVESRTMRVNPLTLQSERTGEKLF